MILRNDARSLIFFAFLDACLPTKAGKTEDRRPNQEMAELAL